MSVPAIWTIASNPGSVPSPLSEPPPYNVAIESPAQEETVMETLRVSVAPDTRSTSETDTGSRMHLQLALPPKIANYFRHPWSERYYRQGWAIGAAHSTTCLWDCHQRWGLWRCLPALHSMINSTFHEGRTKPPPGWTSWFSWREGERADFFHASNGWSLSYHAVKQSWTTDIVSTFTTNFAQFTYIQCNTMMLHLGTK